MNDVATIYSLNERIFPFLIAWLLLSMRFLGFALVFPLFSWVNLTTTVRAAFAAAMAAPLAYIEFTNPGFVKTLSADQISLLSLKEIFVGVLIGLLAGLPFWAAQTCGELIDTYRGSSAGALFDPSLTTETSELGAGLILFALAALVASGGFAQLIGAIYLTLQVWPAETMLPTLQLQAGMAGAGTVGAQLLMGIGMAGAILLCLLAVDLALAFFGRATRQIQIFDISLSVKNLAFVLLLPLLGGALASLIMREVGRGAFQIDKLLLMLPFP